MAFAALFAAAAVLVCRIVWPFLMPVLLAGFLVVLMSPFHEALRRRVRRGAFAAAASTLATLGLVCLPIVAVAWLVGRELLDAAAGLRELPDGPDALAFLGARLPRTLARFVPGLEQVVPATLTRGAELLSRALIAGTGVALDLLLMAIALYYFFLDGRRLVGELGRLLPLEERYFDAFVHEVQEVIRAILFGSTVTALAQAVVGFLGFWVAGVSHPLVWAAAMALTAMIPIGGTALVWAPLGIALIATGRLESGIFLLVWGMVPVGAVDSLLRPRLCGSRMAVHPLVVFVSIFGGLAAFGVAGIVVGPLACALLMSMVRIYRRDFLEAARPGRTAPEGPVTRQPGLAREV